MSINSGDMSINSGEREDKNYGQSQPGNREVEILNSLDETEIGPSDNDSEFQEILGHFEPVFSQVTSGSKWLKRLTGLLSGVDKLGYSYHKSLTKIVELERLKVRNLNKDDQQKVKKDKMGGNWKAQLKLYDILDRIAFANLDFSSSVKVDIVGELEEAIKDNQMRIKTVYKDVETFLKILNASFLKTKKLKHKCSAAIKTRNQILQRDDTLKEDRKNKMSIFSKISVVVHNSPTSAESKVKSLKLQYEEAIQHANALKETWETKKLPEILMMLEKIEKDRVQKMKENGLRVVNALKSLASSIQVGLIIIAKNEFSL